jgi:hypothetical protein
VPPNAISITACWYLDITHPGESKVFGIRGIGRYRESRPDNPSRLNPQFQFKSGAKTTTNVKSFKNGLPKMMQNGGNYATVKPVTPQLSSRFGVKAGKIIQRGFWSLEWYHLFLLID